MRTKISILTTQYYCIALVFFFLPQIGRSQSEHPSVIVSEAQSALWFDHIEALGTLRANETVLLTASVTDTVTKIHFDDGQRVEKGFVLAEMTDEEESALVREMTARVSEAKKQYQRLKDLPKTGAVSESLYDQREREYRAAKAQLEAMKSRLRDRLIIAPFSGILGLRNISVGALVEPGDEIVTITDDSVMKLDFAVPAVFLNSLEPGLSIVAQSAAFPHRTFEGTVSSIDSRVNESTRSIIVRARIPNEERLLKPGLLLSVDLRYRNRQAIQIPEEALIPSGDSNFILVVDKNSSLTEKRQVVIGNRQVGKVEVVKNLQEGELVITHGTMAARPGLPVSIRAIQQENESVKEILRRKDSSQ